MVRLRPVRMGEAAKYLGYGTEKPDEVILSLMQQCEAPLLEACKPAYSVGIFQMQEEEDGIRLEDCALYLTGVDIRKHLEGCEQVVLFAATLGSGVDRLLRQLQITSMPKALLTDAMASAVIEQICDDIQQELAEQLPEYVQTWRFSPGYGDLPLSLQSTLLASVEAGKRIGLTVLESNLCTPQKSVTAIVGLRRKQPVAAEEAAKAVDGSVSIDLEALAASSGCNAPGACSRCRFGESCQRGREASGQETP